MEIPKSLIGAGSVAVLGTGMFLAITATKQPVQEMTTVDPVTKKVEQYQTSLQKCDDKGQNCVPLSKAEYEAQRAYCAGLTSGRTHFEGTWQDLQLCATLTNEDAEAKNEPVIQGKLSDDVIVKKINERLKPATVKPVGDIKELTK
ncbi:MAG: hypothetical protein BWY14_00999 [Parcubacteria group bacterium ADurb.Bin192]|nr:MAG: hypothetical protein BWY14_00999 [Parcubacteria group bacterium ADurb.Bin192]